MPTTFLDGPAQGSGLCLRRAPLFLRVVVGPGGAVDALDMLNDRPRPEEEIIVYQLVRNEGTIHINSRDRKTGRHTGGWFQRGVYRVFEPQPPRDCVRTAAAWREWATKQAADTTTTK